MFANTMQLYVFTVYLHNFQVIIIFNLSQLSELMSKDQFV